LDHKIVVRRLLKTTIRFSFSGGSRREGHEFHSCRQAQRKLSARLKAVPSHRTQTESQGLKADAKAFN
jgi:hypothetical protein